MKRFTNMLWAAVAVLGLYSPVFSYAGSPFANFSSKGAVARSGQSSQSSSSNSSVKSMPYSGNVFKTQIQKSGGLSTQVLNKPIINQNLGGKFGKGPILTMPGGLGSGNGLPPVSKTPGGKFPGGIGPILDPGFGKGGKGPIVSNPFPGGIGPILDPGNGKPPKKPIFDPGNIGPILDPGLGGGKGPKVPFPGGGIGPILDPGAVSYTHLTLPTNREV